MLHTVNKNHPSPALASCLRVATAGSTVLLIESGVYNAVAQSLGAKLLTAAMPHLRIRLLMADVMARGLAERIIPGCDIITDIEFVDLVAGHSKTLAWF